MRRTFIALYVIARFVSITGVAAADRPSAPTKASPTTPALSLKLSSVAASAPAPLRTTVIVRPHDDNRLLRIAIDGDRYYRSSDIELEGAVAPLSHLVQWRDVPAGRYQVTVQLFGPSGSRAAVSREFVVFGPGFEP
ncbi:MAG: hypothetical protein U0Q12_27785 [Vicinamibacterales bacterium]